jgi:dolichol-phosphate mannosyltransferase
VPTPCVSVVVPCFNEAECVEPVARGALAALEKWSPARFELVLVDDGSTDGTRAAMERVAGSCASVRLVSHETNQGLGAALRTGFAACTGSVVTWIPGDGQFDLPSVLAGLPLLPAHDIVVALRQGRKDPIRGLITLGFHGLTRLLFGFDPTDMCGIYIVKRDVLIGLQPRSRDIFLNLEIPILCARQGRSVGHITLAIHPRLSGRSKVASVRTFVKNFWEMLRFRFQG